MAAFLIDTHVFAWWITDDPKLSRNANTLLDDAATEIIGSLVLPWEVTVKTSIGRWEGGDEVVTAFNQCCQRGVMTLLPPTLRDLAILRALPHLHGDPFDRMLIAQSISNCLPIISADKKVSQYDLPVIW